MDIDTSGLRDFYKSDICALKVLDYFAGRDNDSHITTVISVVDRLNGLGHPTSRADVRRVFKALGRFRCGEFIKEPKIMSAKNQQSIFKWDVAS